MGDGLKAAGDFASTNTYPIEAWSTKDASIDVGSDARRGAAGGIGYIGKFVRCANIGKISNLFDTSRFVT
jgi:hypothetical protein